MTEAKIAVYSAVSLEQQRQQEDLEQPLLQVDEENDGRFFFKDKLLFCLRGLIIGFLAQLINVSGTTYLHYQWKIIEDQHPLQLDWSQWLQMKCIWLVSQVDLALYLCMWLSLTAVLTKRGMGYVQFNFFRPGVSSRSIFVCGVMFYVGVVLGVFIAWAAIDLSVGAFVPLLPMFAVVLFGLFISYIMVWCYDLEKEDDEYDDDNA